jgi:hypothetical protein
VPVDQAFYLLFEFFYLILTVDFLLLLALTFDLLFDMFLLILNAYSLLDLGSAVTLELLY